MSERGEELTTQQVGCLLIFSVLALVIMIVWVSKGSTDQIRDLQRRVGQLESERR